MVVDGVELLEMIRNRQIKDRTKIYLEKSTSNDYNFYTMTGIFIQLHLWREDKKGKEKDVDIRVLDTNDLLNYRFIIPEEDKEIDIQAIYDFDEVRDLSTWSNETLSDNQRTLIKRVSQLIKAIKQLDNKIK